MALTKVKGSVWSSSDNYIAACPIDFGAKGDGATDDTAAIVAALATSKFVDFGSSSLSYKVSSAITLQSGTTLSSGGATITQTTANTEIFNIEGKSNIEIYGINFVGKGNDFLDSDSSRAVAIYGSTSGSNISIHNNKFTGFTYSAIKVSNQSIYSIKDNIIIGPGVSVITSTAIGRVYGILSEDTAYGVISGNVISETAQGVRAEATANLSIADNTIYNIRGQHGIYAGQSANTVNDFTTVSITGNNIHNCALVGIKVQHNDAAAANAENIVVSGNSVRTCGEQGILVYNSTASPTTYKLNGVSITGNTINATTSDGIYIGQSTGATVSGNTIVSSSRYGILYTECDSLTISDNTIRICAYTGIRDIYASNDVSIIDNHIRNPAGSNIVGDEYGIYVGGVGTRYNISGNYIGDGNAAMQHGIYIPAAINADLSMVNNTVTNSTDYAVRFGSTTALREYRGNNWNGTLGAAQGEVVPPSVASAATITLPTGADVVNITGTTNITGIVANGHSGRIVTLIFAGILTVTRGSNIQIASNFVTTSQDTLTIVCDGVNWYEIARAVC